MNSSVNKLIIAAGVILVILIIVTIFISGSIKTKQTSQQPTLIPTGIFESSGGSGGFNSNDQQGSDQGAILARLSDEQRKLIKPGNEYSPISADQSSKLQDLASKMPYSSSDFDIGYSAALAQFFIQKKTPGADTALNKFFQDNGILDVFNQNPDLFVFTDQPVSQAIQNTESALGQIREENQNLQQQQTQQQNSQQTQQNQTKKPINLTKDQQQTIVRDNNMLKSFAEFAGSLFNFNTGSSSNLQDIVNSALTPIPTPTGNAGGGNNGGGGGGNCSGNGNIPDQDLPTKAISSVLSQILIEAGTCVGVSPKVIESTFVHECGGPLNQSTSIYKDAYIDKASQPGQGIPFGDPCYYNRRTQDVAYGIFQELDAFFKSYGSTINSAGGYHYPLNLPSPHPQLNIKMAAYAAAAAYKAGMRNAGVNHPYNLSESEFLHIIGAFTGYNFCAGNSSTCQTTWNFYKNSR